MTKRGIFGHAPTCEPEPLSESELFSAVCVRMVGHHNATHPGTWDTADEVEGKRVRLASIRAWAEALKDRDQRRAYVQWCDAAEYSIKRHLESLRIQAVAPSLPLPPDVP